MDGTPPMQPHTSELPLTRDELDEAAELLTHFSSCVGHVPDVVMALLKTLLVRRDGASRVVVETLRSCCVPTTTDT